MIAVLYMSPGSVKERLSFFLAHYSPRIASPRAAVRRMRARTSRSSSCRSPTALAMVKRGEIIDSKTVILLQHVALYGSG